MKKTLLSIAAVALFFVGTVTLTSCGGGEEASTENATEQTDDAADATEAEGEMKCGEGKCGDGMATETTDSTATEGEMKCGEGKCGEGKCGEGDATEAEGEAVEGC